MQIMFRIQIGSNVSSLAHEWVGGPLLVVARGATLPRSRPPGLQVAFPARWAHLAFEPNFDQCYVLSHASQGNRNCFIFLYQEFVTECELPLGTEFEADRLLS